MTSKQATKAMLKMYPDCSIHTAVNSWNFNHCRADGVTYEYAVYAGNTDGAVARGAGISFEAAIANLGPAN